MAMAGGGNAAFSALLAQLAEQHERELNTIREENRRLALENSQLREQQQRQQQQQQQRNVGLALPHLPLEERGGGDVVLGSPVHQASKVTFDLPGMMVESPLAIASNHRRSSRLSASDFLQELGVAVGVHERRPNTGSSRDRMLRAQSEEQPAGLAARRGLGRGLPPIACGEQPGFSRKVSEGQEPAAVPTQVEEHAAWSRRLSANRVTSPAAASAATGGQHRGPRSATAFLGISLGTPDAQQKYRKRHGRQRQAQSNHAALLDKSMAKVSNEVLFKQRVRFLTMFNLGEAVPDSHWISAEELLKALRQKGLADIGTATVAAVIRELNEVQAGGLRAVCEQSGGSQELEDVGIEFGVLFNLMMMPSLPARVRSTMASTVEDVQSTLLLQDVREVIAKVTRAKKVGGESGGSLKNIVSERGRAMLWYMNLVVSVTVLLSLVCLGVRLDMAAGSVWWVTLECLFATVFVSELSLKNVLLGPRTYFTGSEWQWNWFDSLITLAAVLDSGISWATLLLEQEDGYTSVAKLVLALRVLRLVRIIRLIKLLRAPFVRELANMLAGFFIGSNAMIWVMVVLWVVVYFLAVGLRQVVGPPSGQDLVSKCGSGDSVLDPADPECEVLELYSEEYFGTVPKSMFTVFRCMTGDCTTKAGQALVMHFSEGYGMRFDLVYCAGMVLMIFGLFNIITAIFVDATMQGLKYNDVRRKYASLYQSQYMRGKLEDLVEAIRKLLPPDGGHEDVTLSEQEFHEVLQDAKVASLLDDLDVAIDHQPGLFSTFDTDDDGRVSLPELISTLMKLRGELHKSDMVASWAAIESLQTNFQEFELVLLANQKEMMSMQRALVSALDVPASPSTSITSP